MNLKTRETFNPSMRGLMIGFILVICAIDTDDFVEDDSQHDITKQCAVYDRTMRCKV